MIISSASVSLLKSRAMVLSALAKATDTFIEDVSEDVLLAFVMKETRGSLNPLEVLDEINEWWMDRTKVD